MLEVLLLDIPKFELLRNKPLQFRTLFKYKSTPLVYKFEVPTFKLFEIVKFPSILKSPVCETVTATSFNATSDRRIKQNILPIINETIDLIKPRKYFNKLTNKEEFGLIADELQEVYSNIVNGEKGGDVLQSVNYIQMIPLLIKEVQELKNKFKLLNI